MIRAYDEYGNIVDLVEWEKKIMSKAIDDFAEKLSLEISESIIWGMLIDSDKDNNFNDTSEKIVDYVIEDVKEIAEQLKAGKTNGNKNQ